MKLHHPTTCARSAPPYYCGNGHGPQWDHGTCWCGSSYITDAAVLPGEALPSGFTWRRARTRVVPGPSGYRLNIEAGRVTLPVALAAVLLALAGIAAVLAFTPGVGAAQALDAPGRYQVGDVEVFYARTRNESCSVTRNVRNTGPVPLRVIASATWPGQPVHLPPNQGSHGGDAILPPGDQLTAVWTNSHYVTDGALNLTWTVLIPDGVAQIGANRLEPVPACNPTPEPSQTSTSTVPPVASSAPSTTGPPPSTTARVVSTPEPSPPPGVETTTTAPDGVLTSSQRRVELPATGRDNGPALVIAGIVVALGVLALLTSWHLGRISDTYPPGDDEDDQL